MRSEEVFHSAISQQAIAAIFGLNNYHLHEIINDTSGELQHEALNQLRIIRAMQHRQAKRERVEHYLWQRDMRLWTRINRHIASLPHPILQACRRVIQRWL